MKKILVAIFSLFLFMPIFAQDIPVSSANETVMEFATQQSKENFNNGIKNDILVLGDIKIVDDYVPIDAKIGRAFIAGLSKINSVLDRSLFRFISIFMIILFAFWVILEGYNFMEKGGDSIKLGKDIVIKGVLVAVWSWIIANGPAEMFMTIMGPIIAFGTAISDMILNAIVGASGAVLPDTCAAIHNYMAQNPIGSPLIDSAQTANLLCVPTRLSGFFLTGISAGFSWMWAGIGTSALTFFVGFAFVVLFIFNMWKFGIMALGVILHLFFGLMFLPFTAIAMTFGPSEDKDYGGGAGATNYKGIGADIYNAFLNLFNVKNFTLKEQISRFINAIIRFVSLSIVIGLCAGILSYGFDIGFANSTPSIENDGFITPLLVGCLVAYLAGRANEIADNIGGKIESGIGDKFGKDVRGIFDKAVGGGKKLIGLFKK